MMRDYQAAARDVIATLGEPAARDLLTLLESDDTVRADAFRQLYERGGNDALLDSLHDLEADLVMRGWLVEYLRLVLRSCSADAQLRRPHRMYASDVGE